mmetsp:Transcript_1268/g.2719  ORF Transcript_1268/g.2719 Transcript_1268/m.2719 type:complete len:99 (+) Transcript_1268:868-1164(+)
MQIIMQINFRQMRKALQEWNDSIYSIRRYRDLVAVTRKNLWRAFVETRYSNSRHSAEAPGKDHMKLGRPLDGERINSRGHLPQEGPAEDAAVQGIPEG